MNEEKICPKCGCNRFFIAVPGLIPEDEFYECAYCRAIFEITEIDQKEYEQAKIN